MAGDKFRIRFRKRGDLRFLSHHDLMRTFERMLRRAAIPFRSTAGFHPKPRMVFASSLPLGVVGLDEVVELEVTEELPEDDVLARLAAQQPHGLEFRAIRRIPTSLTGQPCRAIYRLPIPDDRRTDLAERCFALLARPDLWVERTHPQPKRVDVRPYVLDLRLDDDSLWIDLRITPTGAARADELVKLLGAGDLLDAGAVLERTTLELIDETAPDRPPSHAGDPVPDAAALAAVAVADDDALPDC